MKTLSGDSYEPDRPDFSWEHLPSENGLESIKVNWLPNVNGRPGTHFFVKYRVKGEIYWSDTDYVLDEDFIIIRGLIPDETYEVVVISVDGNHMADSENKEIQTTVNSVSTLDLSTGNGTCQMFYCQ